MKMKSQQVNNGNPRHVSRDRTKRKYSPFAKPFIYKIKTTPSQETTHSTYLSDTTLSQKIKSLINETITDASEKHVIEKDFFGLPAQVKSLLEIHKGIKSLYEWQEECLKLPNLLERKNFVYSLPTSGGKTLIAEILILKEILCYHRNVLFVLPFISIVQEKIRSLSPFAVAFDFIIEEYAGPRGSYPPKVRKKRNVVYIATIEKAHNLISSLIESGQIAQLGLAVIDELHMISEAHRGICLEIGLIKLLYRSANTQIIGMSATIGNLQQLASFLKADLFQKEFRPVTLYEYVKVENDLFIVDRNSEDVFTKQRTILLENNNKIKTLDEDNITGLVLEVMPNNSCLLFCPTKVNCENVCKMLSKSLPKFLLEHRIEEKQNLVLALKRQGNGKMCQILKKSLLVGVAYHHAGLTSDERSLLEESFMSGVIGCLCCTSTLAAGVNLPARRVILRSPYVARNVLSVSQYKQMIGRAGRAGLDSLGESIIICQKNEVDIVKNLVTSSFPDCKSMLGEEGGKGLISLCLSCIASSVVCTARQISQLFSLSLWAKQIEGGSLNQDETIKQYTSQILSKLKSNKLIWIQRKCSQESQEIGPDDKISVTSLGKAAVAGGIDLDFAKILYDDLKIALHCLALNTHLHLLYLITPYDLLDSITFNQNNYLKAYSSLSSSDLVAANAIGADERTLVKIMSGHKLDERTQSKIHRFYVTLVLNDIYINKSIWAVASKYDIHRGTIQSMLSSVLSFASCVQHFVQPLQEFWAYDDLLSSFIIKMNNGLSQELAQLLELPGIKHGRARLLYNNGFKTLNCVARATPEDIASKVEFIPIKVARQIISSAKMIIFEKAEALIEEAEILSMGISNAVERV